MLFSFSVVVSFYIEWSNDSDYISQLDVYK